MTKSGQLKEILSQKYNLFGKNLGTSYMVVQRKSDEKWGVIDIQGIEKAPFIYEESSELLKNGYYALMDKHKKWHVFNTSATRIATSIENLNNFQ